MQNTRQILGFLNLLKSFILVEFVHCTIKFSIDISKFIINADNLVLSIILINISINFIRFIQKCQLTPSVLRDLYSKSVKLTPRSFDLILPFCDLINEKSFNLLIHMYLDLGEIGKLQTMKPKNRLKQSGFRKQRQTADNLFFSSKNC
ncbi:hypothetical protein BpHYR1_053016 [Brachionus plicatilis]|uniref:Uncharacterized protein n=1 Tax=Brachionus plicatilis TaxID=10195 RepID=A0A3M7SA97_BRAPC|nr:hypothetical protein BpHYR1_053016 [Brachionus plicatilis]